MPIAASRAKKLKVAKPKCEHCGKATSEAGTFCSEKCAQADAAKLLDALVSTKPSDSNVLFRKELSLSRAVIRDRLVDALGVGELASAGQIFDVATAVESALYDKFGESKDCKARFRTLSFNLKDEKNVELRARVLSQEISAQRYVPSVAYADRLQACDNGSVGTGEYFSC